MEMPASSSAGISGRSLGTERPPAFLPSSLGELFAHEVQRAGERSRGDGLRARRLDDLESERRELRRASFGHEREGARETPPAREDDLRPEHAPVVARAAAAPARELPAGGSGSEPAPPAAPHAEQGGQPGPAAQPATTAVVAPPASAPPVAPAARATNAPAVEVSAPPAAPRNDPLPAEVAQIVRAARTGKAAAGARAPAGPDPALLERAHEVLRQIQLHLSPGVRRIALELEPAELGRVAIQLALRAGKVTAIVRGERSETLALLEQREGELAQLLAQRGVPADSIRFELGFSGQRPGGSSAHRLPPPAPSHRQGLEAAPSAAPSVPRASTSLVDTFA